MKIDRFREKLRELIVWLDDDIDVPTICDVLQGQQSSLLTLGKPPHPNEADKED